jgi:lipoprotein-anchoring transpeptidase ErfK/SrfK
VDVALLQAVGSAPEDWLEASQVASMACESVEEVLSERFHVRPLFLRELNPHVTDWSNVPAGTRLLVPNVTAERRRPEAAAVQIDCAAFRLRACDSNGCVLASFPCSIARDLAQVPTGALSTTAFAADPVYVFDPANYRESARAQEIGRKLVLPPGPNNPVGMYWIGLNRPGFGIHGTRHPETIGSRESHGCFRLTNWDIVTLARMLRTGVPVVLLQ